MEKDQIQQQLTSTLTSLKEMKESTAVTLLVAMTLIVILIAFLYYFYFKFLRSRECSAMNTIYGELNGKIKSIDDNPNFNYSLRDYYIKTAYNCCSGGNYRNDYVDTCVLKSVLKQGVRGLDFEIYSINDQPVIATSTSDNYHVKETFNYINFADAMDIIRDYAFSTSTAPNSKDPIILHLRIRSQNQKMYENFALLLKNYDNILLGKEYDSEYYGQNFGSVKIKNLLGKVTIIVEKFDNAYLECPEFYKFINMTSNSVFMKAICYNDIASMQITTDELVSFNRQFMTICMPNPGPNPPNPDFNAMIGTGCQMLAMRYSLVDANIETNDAFFNENGYAFALKPQNLRYIPETIPMPPPQNPELSYATRTVESDYYKFNM